MNEHMRGDCERYEAVLAAWFDDDALSPSEREAFTAHAAVCASCRESFELSARMESALESRSTLVPSFDAFLPALRPARSPFAHPRLVGAFRAVMSPAGIAITLVMWSTMLAYHFRHTIAGVLELSSSQRLSAWVRDVTDSLLGVSGGDPYALVAIYVALMLIVLGSTGAITMRYIRHSQD